MFSKHLRRSVTLTPEKITEVQRSEISQIKAKPFVWVAESLNFDMMLTKVFKDRVKDKWTIIMEWIAYLLIGIAIGLITAIMSHTEAFLIHEKKLLTD